MWSQIWAHVGVIVSYTSVSYSNSCATVTYVDFYGEIVIVIVIYWESQLIIHSFLAVFPAFTYYYVYKWVKNKKIQVLS